MKVLLTNDDGPPSSKVSPYIFAFYQHLTALGWDVKVVVPSSQKSWIGKAFHITEVTKGRYFYPTKPDGLTGETSETSRPLKEGEVAEWILLDGTPATCANVGLHNLYPGEIDLVLSGPNLGRNTSSAFALSSGTIGAALDGALTKTRSIAVSYGTVVHPTPAAYFEPAHVLACRIITHLWDNWGNDDGGLRTGEVDLYNVNIPLVEGLSTDESLPIIWTSMWRNSYGRLFKAVSSATPGKPERTMSAAGPDALTAEEPSAESTSTGSTAGTLAFKFSPAMDGLIHPEESSLPVGSDGWAIFKGYASVTPLRAGFAEPPEDTRDIKDRVWKMKL
ncbi:survival protein sure-like phosphatase/nucleotidase [Mycena alexandri]|uniref:Survival protein sure-like phosphatase/nucleotidase n=1 Tax=Mycena alexandri TaxID=1745969 RepID=A0AAD6T2L0_9AGAR|nr:survival protein sure-like phosphatase/nucleotidase [Mycena alexandri]